MGNIQSFLINALQNLIYTLPVVLISLMVHEVMHGFVSYKLGDPTAKQAGRLNFNPLKHLDPLGTLSMILFRFGWAKPVPINPAFYKNQKRGIILVSLAGPLSNVCLAFFSMILTVLLQLVVSVLAPSGILLGVFRYLYGFLNMMIIININFAVFNIIPISPLDGSKILYALLPDRIYYKILQYEQYGMLVLMVLIWTNVLNRPLSFLTGIVWDFLAHIVNFLFAWI